MLCICDKEVEKEYKDSDTEFILKNREIADWICENIQDSDFYAPSYYYTSFNWRNYEE